MKKKTMLCAALLFGALPTLLRLDAGEVPEISTRTSQNHKAYPETVGGAPGSGGRAMGVPDRPSQIHGWKLPAPNRNHRVYVREILRMAGPGTWTIWAPERKYRISQNRDSCETTWFDYPANGWIGNEWTIDPVDPRGWYKFEIYFDGRLAAEIPFEVK